MMMNMKRWGFVVLCGLALLALVRGAGAQREATPVREFREWKMFGGGPENTHYSTLRQITRENVQRLATAWVYDTGDAFPGSEMQCNPVIADGVLYATSPKLRVIALDAATGRLLWSSEPDEGKKPVGKMRNRGFTYWE